MQCERLVFSGHAVQRVFERAISVEDVREVVERGELIAAYPDDTPYPSSLLLGFVHGRPLHVVAALDQANATCYVITAYVPDPGQWADDFRARRAR